MIFFLEEAPRETIIINLNFGAKILKMPLFIDFNLKT